MDFKEYVKLAMRTNIQDRSFKDNILNGLLGLFGESCEFMLADEYEQLDELSDLYWYIALLFHTTGFEPLVTNKPTYSLMTNIGLLSDHFKKHFFQGHRLDDKWVQKLLSEIKFHLDFMAMEFVQVQPCQVWEHNIEKLKKRFPDGFEVEKSINREMN